MKIRRFQAKTFREALALVKQEMGEDAVILSSEERKGRMPSVEVAAAADYDRPCGGSEWKPALPPVRHRPPLREQGIGKEPAEFRELADVIVETDSGEFGPLGDLMEASRRPIEPVVPPEVMRVFRFLEGKGIRREHAVRLCGSMGAPRDVLSRVVTDMAVWEGLGADRKAVLLVGPTGVGKTTTVAKLTAAAVKAGRKSAIVSLDTYRIGAIEQIRIYANILGVPLTVARDASEVKEGIARHPDRDVVFIDTMGRNPSSDTLLAELAPVYEAGIPVETHLLMSANSDYHFLAAAVRNYGKLPVDCLGVTKADETAKPGAIYNLLALCEKPVAYVTTGQTVPGDIEFPTRERMAEMVLSDDFFRKEEKGVA